MKKSELLVPISVYLAQTTVALLGLAFIFLQNDFHISLSPLLLFIVLASTVSMLIAEYKPIIHQDIEYNVFQIIDCIIIFYCFLTRNYLAILVHSLISNILFTQILKREWQKFYLNLTYGAGYNLILFDMMLLTNFKIHSSLIEFVLFSSTITFISIIVDFILTGGFYSKERGSNIFISFWEAIYVFSQLSIYSSLGLLFIYFGENYSYYTLIFIFINLAITYYMYSSYFTLKAAEEESIELLTKTLEAKDPYTANHSKRVAKYAMYAGTKLRLAPWRIKRLQNAALLHDIGKLVVPSEILNKPGKLTDTEFRKMKKHEEVTSQLLTMIDFLNPVATFTTVEKEKETELKIIPKKLEKFFSSFHKKKETKPIKQTEPIEANIIYVADAYDAMTSSRSYRKALSQEVAFAELRACAGKGKQFDKKAVEALISSIEKRKEIHGLGFEEENFHKEAPTVGTGSAGLGDLDEAQKEVSDAE